MDDKVADRIIDHISKMETGFNKKANGIIDHMFKMEARLNHKIEAYRDEFTEFKNGVYDHIDAVLGELKTTREEQISLSHRTSNLEGQVETIQKIPVIAHSIKW